MTIGTRIQALRKERGMSQEELAGKLSVSRQTVSQWETEQTVPSIDNIYTLKEIFDVSFDALMSEPAENQHSTAAIPHRHGETRYTVEDIKSVTRLVVMPRILGTLFAAILFIIILALPAAGDNRTDTAGFFIAFVFSLAILIMQIIQAVSYKKNSLKQVADRIYEYDLYADRMVITVKRNGELSSRFVVRPEDVTKVIENRTHTVFLRGTELFILRKSDPLYEAVRPYISVQKTVPAASGKEKTISALLIILSILSPAFAIAVFEAVTPEVPFGFAMSEAINRFWIFYLFLPIPLASAIFGIYQRKKGIRNIKNIVVGLILALILAIYGSFTPIFKNTFISDNCVAESYAAQIGVELPRSEKSVTQNAFGDEKHSSVLCEKESFDRFVQNAKKDIRWKAELPTELEGCTPTSTIGRKYDLCLIYNADTKEFNALPTKSGDYRFIFIGVNKSERTLEISDYTSSFNASEQALPGAV